VLAARYRVSRGTVRPALESAIPPPRERPESRPAPRFDALALVEMRSSSPRGRGARGPRSQGPSPRALPTSKFLANAAWTVIAALAHNLLRWMTLIGLPDTVTPIARTLRRRLLAIPGRLTRTGRRVTLRMPARWPWATQFHTALTRLRAIPALN
jgi:hypothetical protein